MHGLPRVLARQIAVGILAALILVTASAAPGAAGAAGAVGRESLTESNPALGKVSSHLLRARKLVAEGRTSAQVASAVSGVRMKDELAEVQVRLEALNSQILDLVRDSGMRIDSFDLGYALVYGRIDPDRLDELAAVPEVSTIHPKPRVGTRVGSASSQADVTMNSDDVRTTLGYDGTGVTVGILSDSFNDGLGGAVSGGVCTCTVPSSTCATVVTGMANQASGDLPGSIPLLDDCTGPGAVPGDPCFGLSDEGAAIGELMFDAAPAADFMFHSAFNSPSDFAGGITELANCGADLIVDDVFWTGQPFFQDGEIAQAAQAAVDGGVPYFSAAGNDATFGVHDTYMDSAVADNMALTPDGDDLHDFGGGDTFAEITLPDDCSIFAELQWSEPFDGTLGSGATSDLDLYLLSSAADPASTGGANILELSTTGTGCGIGMPLGGGDPIESVFYENMTGASDTVFLAIEHFCDDGDEGVDMRIVTISLDCNPLSVGWDFEDGEAGESTIFVDSQIFGHPAAKDVVAVAAAFYGGIDLAGAVEPPFAGQLDVEPFSSLGGDLPFYFDGTGTPLGPVAGPLGPISATNDGPPAPETRFKPEITGPDGTNTTFFGIDIGFDDPNTDPNFFGTSASAPNSAAIAALILDATDELINPLPLKQLLSQASLDMEIPGVDDLSGFGFTDALRPIRSLDSSTTPLIDELEFDLDGGDFFSTPPTPNKRVQAISKLTLGNGDYSGVDGRADEIIFSDGFESGDTSVWTN